MLVGIGLGWSLLPKTMLDASIAELKVANVSLKRSLGYVVHDKRPLSQAAQRMVDLLHKRII